MLTLTSRTAGANDCPQLGLWNRQLIDDEGHHNPMNVEELGERMRRWISSDHQAIIFYLADKPVAYALLKEEPDHYYLRHFLVLRGRRRQGIGRTAFGILRSSYFVLEKRLMVGALLENPSAVAFWRSLGFRDYALTLQMGAQSN